MKKLLLLLSTILITQITVAQPAEYFVDNWYLHSFSFNVEEVFINTLEITEGPTLIIHNDFTLSGHGFCNDYSGNYEYEIADPLGANDTFKPRNIVRETENCGNFQEMENHFFFPFIEERTADIYNITSGSEKHIVLQYTFGYQVYKNYSALGISDPFLKNLVVFPNPAQNKLFIVSEIHDFKSILITDINGRVIMNFEKNYSKEIDISSINSGMYFIRIESSGGNITKKFIKN